MKETIKKLIENGFSIEEALEIANAHNEIETPNETPEINKTPPTVEISTPEVDINKEEQPVDYEGKFKDIEEKYNKLSNEFSTYKFNNGGEKKTAEENEELEELLTKQH